MSESGNGKWLAAVGLAVLGATTLLDRPDVERIEHEHDEHREVVLHSITEQMRHDFGALVAATRELDHLQDSTDDQAILFAILRVTDSAREVTRHGSVFDEAVRERGNVLAAFQPDFTEAQQTMERAKNKIEDQSIKQAAQLEVDNMKDTVLLATSSR